MRQLALAVACVAVAAGCSLDVLPVPVGGLSQQPVGPPLEPSGGAGGMGGDSFGCPDAGDAGACFDASDGHAAD